MHHSGLVNPRRACAARVTVVVRVCVCVCLSVKSKLTSGASVRPETSVIYSTANEGQKNCGDFSKNAPLQRFTTSCIVAYCSDIPRNFSTAEPSKGPKKANNRLNSAWNTTRCKAASFFLFSLRLLPKVFRILPINVIRYQARALQGFRNARTPRVLHFSAFISLIFGTTIPTSFNILVKCFLH